MDPTQALIACSDLCRDVDPARAICHVCLERTDDTVVILATNGHSAFRFDFPAVDFPPNHWIQKVYGSWHAPGAHFPKWGSKHWEVNISSEMIHLTACAKSGKPLNRQPPAVLLDAGQGPVLALWDQITRQSNPIKIDISSATLLDCVEPLDGDAVVHMYSPDGVDMIVTAGMAIHTHQWRAVVDLFLASRFRLRAIRASLLRQALEVCKPTHMLLGADDANAPIIFTSPAHTAIVMPMRM